MNQHISPNHGAISEAFKLASAHPDQELIRLGKSLDEACSRERPIREKAHGLNDLHRGKLESGEITLPEFRAAIGSAEVAAAFNAHEDIGIEIDAITAQIRAIPATTIHGLAIKIRALAYDARVDWKFDFDNADDLDWDVQCFQQLYAETNDILAGLG